MNTETETIQVFNPEKFSETLTTAPAVLEANKTSVERAKSAGQTMLDTIEASGMSDELDAAANDLQVKIRKTYETMQERRKPITQLLTEVSKSFTLLEAEIDPKNPNSHFAKVQTYRNSFAQDKLAKQREAERQAKIKLEKEKELADYRAKCEIAISQHFNIALTKKTEELTNIFNTATLETIDTQAQVIIAFSTMYPAKYHQDAKVEGVFYTNITDAEMKPILDEVLNDMYAGFADQYEKAITEHKESLSIRIPARRNELQEIANAQAEAERQRKAAEEAAKSASAEEAARLKVEAEKSRIESERIQTEAKAREDAQKAKEAEEAKARQEEAEKKAKSNKQAATMQSLFDAAADSAPQATNAKEAYEIEVKNNAGYLLIAQFWFEKEGLKATIDEIEKKTFKQMKAFAEKWALKNEEFIKSPFIIYNEVAKATVKK